MMLPNLIKKEIRKNVFSLPFSWSLQEQLFRGLKDDVTCSSENKMATIKNDQGIESNPFYGKYSEQIKKAVDKEGIKIAEKIGNY